MLKRLVIPVLLLALYAAKLEAQPQAPGKTVLDGVYSEAQAERGKAIYEGMCSRCHGDLLEGVSAPTLSGPQFIDRWREDTMDTIFNFLRAGMPPGRDRDGAAPIADNLYVDMLAHILKTNGYSSGANELTAAALPDVLLIGKDGPKPVPDGSLVMTVGCLSQAPTGAWILFSATEPTRTRTPNDSSPAEMSASSQKRPGTLIFRLVDMEAVPDFSPAAHKGHKMQAKGFIVRQRNAERINLSSIEMLGETCGQ